MRINSKIIRGINEAYARILSEDMSLDELKQRYEEYTEKINMLKDQVETAIEEDDRWLAKELNLEIDYVTRQRTKLAKKIEQLHM
jgi:phage shock protein A